MSLKRVQIAATWLGRPADPVAGDGSPDLGSARVDNQYMVAGLVSDCFAIDPRTQPCTHCASSNRF
jgi:hypothetical protein